MGKTVRVRFVNKQTSSILVRLEPWLDEFENGENDSVLLTGQNSDKGELQFEVSSDEIVVYGTAGSICELTRVTN